MDDELHEKIRRAQIAAGEKVVCEYLEKSGLLKPRAMAEDDIPVSAAMMEAGCTEWPYRDVEHFAAMTMCAPSTARWSGCAAPRLTPRSSGGV